MDSQHCHCNRECLHMYECYQKDCTSQSIGDLVELPVLQCLPEPMGEVEEHPLQQQDEGDPLVVRVVDLLVVLLGLGQARVGKVLAFHSAFVCKGI